MKKVTPLNKTLHLWYRSGQFLRWPCYCSSSSWTVHSHKMLGIQIPKYPLLHLQKWLVDSGFGFVMVCRLNILPKNCCDRWKSTCHTYDFPEKEIYRIKMDQQLKFGFLKSIGISQIGLSENGLQKSIGWWHHFPRVSLSKNVAIFGV